MTNKEKYVQYYKIAQNVVNNPNLLPARSDDEIARLVSQNDWLMFLIGEFTEMDEAKTSDRPNIFFTIYTDDNKEYGRVGLTFNNMRSIETLKNILSKHCQEQKEALTKQLKSLDGVWEITVSRKIKDANFAQTPKYQEEFHANSNEINDDIIDQLIGWVTTIREEGKKKRDEASTFYLETPSVNLIDSRFVLTVDEFSSRIKDAFAVLQICLDVKSDRELKSVEKERNTQLKELTERAEVLREKIAKADYFVKMGMATQAQIEEKKKELVKVERQISELE